MTRASYIKRVGQKSIDAMDRLEAAIRKLVRKGPKGVKTAPRRSRTALMHGRATIPLWNDCLTLTNSTLCDCSKNGVGFVRNP